MENNYALLLATFELELAKTKIVVEKEELGFRAFYADATQSSRGPNSVKLLQKQWLTPVACWLAR